MFDGVEKQFKGKIESNSELLIRILGPLQPFW
jgi:hypothetical protein